MVDNFDTAYRMGTGILSLAKSDLKDLADKFGVDYVLLVRNVVEDVFTELQVGTYDEA